MSEFEIVTELPPRKPGTSRASKYTDFWEFVNDHPGSWVKWPYQIGKGTGNLAKHHGLKFAKRNGECFFQREADSEAV